MPHIDLLELPYFEGISLDHLVSLVELMEPRQFAANQVIVVENTPTPPPLYIATRGNVQIRKRTPAGDDRPLAELNAPTLFGEIELFCQIPAVATAVAVTRVDAFALSRETFDRLFKSQHPGLLRFTFNVAKVACHRLAVSDEIMARRMGNEDLVAARQAMFSALTNAVGWPETTGAFKRPDKL